NRMSVRGEHGPESRSAAAPNVTARAANSRENACLCGVQKCYLPTCSTKERKRKNYFFSSTRDTTAFCGESHVQKIRVYIRSVADQACVRPRRYRVSMPLLTRDRDSCAIRSLKPSLATWS